MVEMIRDALIIIPNISAEDQVCDFLMQTAKRLARKNTVFMPIFDSQFQKNVRHQGVHLVRFIEILPFRRFAIVNRLNKLLYFFGLQLFLQLTYLGLSRRYIWMLFPELAELLQMQIPCWKVIFDIVDFHYAADTCKQKRLEQQKNFLLKKADHVFAISHTLQKLYQPFARNKIQVVPQGFDVDSFARSQPSHVPIPRGKPVIGFVGQLSERLDFELLHTLIRANRSWNFVFVGPKHHEPNVSNKHSYDKIKSLFNHSNFYHFDKQPRATIASIIKKCDVCVIPYDISLPFNQYSYPMKLFEYFYVGKPIVATPIEELKKFPHLVYLAHTAPGFATKIRHVLMKSWPKSKQRQQLQIAVDNTWEQKLSKISKSL